MEKECCTRSDARDSESFLSLGQVHPVALLLNEYKRRPQPLYSRFKSFSSCYCSPPRSLPRNGLPTSPARVASPSAFAARYSRKVSFSTNGQAEPAFCAPSTKSTALASAPVCRVIFSRSTLPATPDMVVWFPVGPKSPASRCGAWPRLFRRSPGPDHHTSTALSAPSLSVCVKARRSASACRCVRCAVSQDIPARGSATGCQHGKSRTRC